MSDDNRDYEVGLGKPPKHTRFKKGKSGNPNGRPKGTRNFDKEIEEVLLAPVKVTENGKQRKVSSRMAILMRLREMALKGDPRAMVRYLELAAQHANLQEAKSAEKTLSKNDKTILDRFAQSVLQGKDSLLVDGEDDE